MSNNSASRSRKETFFLVLMLMTNRIITNQTLIHTKTAGTGAPLSSIISGILTIGVVFLLTVKFTGRKNRNILSLTESIFGRSGKFILASALLGYLSFSALYLLTETVPLIKLIAFPSTPIWFIAFFFVAGAFMGAVNGASVILKSSVFVTASFIFSLTILAISVLFQSRFTNLFPILGTNATAPLRGGFSGITAYADIILLFLLKPELTARKTAGRTIILATATAVLINILVIVAYTAKIPYPISSEESYPLYLLLKEVRFGRFFQRMDAIFLLSASLNTMLTLSLHLYLISDIFKQALKVDIRRVTLLPASFLLFFSAISIRPLPILSPVLTSAAVVALFIIIAIFTRKEASETNDK